MQRTNVETSTKKRKRNSTDPNSPVKNIQPAMENSAVSQMFQDYRVELDKKHDRHERLVKLSRDVTVESKRIIFLLQRATGTDESSTVLEQAMDKLLQLQKTKLRAIAEELHQQDAYQFIRAFSPGIQEYIEALSFYWYLKERRLVSLAEVQKDLQFTLTKDSDQSVKDSSNTSETASNSLLVLPDSMDISVSVCITPIDYMLGIADLTGELMRLAINSVGAGNLDLPFQVCGFFREVHEGFVSFGNSSREITRKLWTLRQSLQKVETACYTLQFRGSEVPKNRLVEIMSFAPAEQPRYDYDAQNTNDD